MDKDKVWPAIHDERAALAEDLADLEDAQWDTPSLCDEWSVRDLLAHMTATAKTTPPSFFVKIVGSRFSFGKMQAKDVAAERGSSGADALARFRAIISWSKHPPGPIDSWLGEVIIHSADIRRPLGIQHEYPIEAVERVAEFYKGSNLVVGAKKRITGLRLQATDTTWSHGDGPGVSGPILSLVLAMTGRTSAHADLTGVGVATLASRP